jgi:hypothetical protein
MAPGRRAPPRPSLYTVRAASPSSFRLGSRSKLTDADAHRFDDSTPFGSFARAVCSAGVLPRKELFECWEVGTRLHEAFPTAPRVADCAAGHGLLAWVCAFLAASDSHQGGPTMGGLSRACWRTAVAIDVARPASADALAAAITGRFKMLDGAVEYVEGSVDAIDADDGETLLVGVHACGDLTDRIIDAAVRGEMSPLALLPCCHSLCKQEPRLAPADFLRLSEAAASDVLGVSGAVDALRRQRLTSLDYSVDTQLIPRAITPHNALLLARPPPRPPLPPPPPSRMAASSATDLEAERGGGYGLPASGTLPAGEQSWDGSRSSSLPFDGASQPWMTATRIPVGPSVAERHAIARLAARPRGQVWRRSFDTSCWIDHGHVAPGAHVMAAMVRAAMSNDADAWDEQSIAPKPTCGCSLRRDGAEEPGGEGGVEEATEDLDGMLIRAWKIGDDFVHPVSGRRAVTYRVEISSTTKQLSKEDAGQWRWRVREAVDALSGVELR